jgi:hypothetical protein
MFTSLSWEETTPQCKRDSRRTTRLRFIVLGRYKSGNFIILLLFMNKWLPLNLSAPNARSPGTHQATLQQHECLCLPSTSLLAAPWCPFWCTEGASTSTSTSAHCASMVHGRCKHKHKHSRCFKGAGA